MTLTINFVVAELTTPALADAAGAVHAEIKKLEKILEATKAEFAKRGIDRAEGNAFTWARADTVRCALDQKLVKEEMGDAWVTKHSKFTPVSSWRVTVHLDALEAA